LFTLPQDVPVFAVTILSEAYVNNNFFVFLMVFNILLMLKSIVFNPQVYVNNKTRSRAHTEFNIRNSDLSNSSDDTDTDEQSRAEERRREEEELIKAQIIAKTKKLYEAATKSANVSGAKAVVSARSAVLYFVTRDQACVRAKEIETQALAQAHINVREAEAAIRVAKERKSSEMTSRAVVEAVKIALLVKMEARSIFERAKNHADPSFWEPYEGELELKMKGSVFGANWDAVSCSFSYDKQLFEYKQNGQTENIKAEEFKQIASKSKHRFQLKSKHQHQHAVELRAPTALDFEQWKRAVEAGQRAANPDRALATEQNTKQSI
jgi:hypothetical protein